MEFHPAPHLKSKTFVGLILAQITAAFNDQAIHIAALFYASDILIRSPLARIDALSEKSLITLVTACFIAPFILFSPLAGQLADKFSKRTTLVAWKLAEVGIMSVGLAGFLLPLLPGLEWWPEHHRLRVSAVTVVAVVFLMGTHSAFFVPAKYGVMPEILEPAVLSRGNGVLEATSFVAQILGTCFGAWLYLALKVPGAGNPAEREWVIAAILLALAVLGAFASLLIARMPAAHPAHRLTFNWLTPMRRNLGVLFRSRALIVAILGIGFLAFMTLYMRQSLVYEGEMKRNLALVQAEAPDAEVASGDAQHAELRLALLLAHVGLGIGIGSILAGWLSGAKLELGLVPVGGGLLFCLLLAMAAALYLQSFGGMAAALVFVGTSAGFYVVPLYALLQHRSPKTAKGNMVATSNVVNMIFGMLSLVAFTGFTKALEVFCKVKISFQAFIDDPSLREPYAAQLDRQVVLPAALFLVAAGLTAAMFVVLGRLLPDLVFRGALWLGWTMRRRVRVEGLAHLPTAGPVMIATTARSQAEVYGLFAAADRHLHLVAAPAPGAENGRLARIARGAGWIPLDPAADQTALGGRLAAPLRAGGAVALPALDERFDPLWNALAPVASALAAPVVPAFVAIKSFSDGRQEVRVRFGEPLASGAPLELVRGALSGLAAVAEEWE